MQSKWQEAKKISRFFLLESIDSEGNLFYIRDQLSELQCSTVYLVLPALGIAKLLNLNIWPAATLFVFALGHRFENGQQFWALKSTE